MLKIPSQALNLVYTAVLRSSVVTYSFVSRSLSLTQSVARVITEFELNLSIGFHYEHFETRGCPNHN